MVLTTLGIVEAIMVIHGVVLLVLLIHGDLVAIIFMPITIMVVVLEAEVLTIPTTIVHQVGVLEIRTLL